MHWFNIELQDGSDIFTGTKSDESGVTDVTHLIKYAER